MEKLCLSQLFNEAYENSCELLFYICNMGNTEPQTLQTSFPTNVVVPQLEK
jgi:hypothetical protein